jgi:DNA anti-recombination protein RmuC
VVVNGDTVDTGHVILPEDLLGDFDPPRFVWRGHPGGLQHEFGALQSELEGLREFGRQFSFHRDQELRGMEQDARDLARRARQAEGKQREQLESELDDILSEIFEHKNEERRESIASMEERLEEMRDRQAKREAAQTEIIEQRKRELLGEENYLEW